MSRRDRRAAKHGPRAADVVTLLPARAIVVRFHRRQPDMLLPVGIALWPDVTDADAARVLRRVADLLDAGDEVPA